MRRIVGTVVVALAARAVHAAPKDARARAEYDKGIAAYAIEDYAAASTALGASYDLEADPETLFAWAQAEKNLGRCDKAIELYGKLLELPQPAENKRAIEAAVRQCKDVLAKQQPPPPEPPPPTTTTTTTAQPHPPPLPPEPPPAARRWWQDPVGVALIAGGVVGAGVSGVLFVQAHGADQDAVRATTYADYKTLRQRAAGDALGGEIVGVSAVVLAGAAAVWYATRPEPGRSVMAGWLAPGGGGLVVAGGF